ncbi:MAG: glycosyltransferase family 2 protein [Nitrospiraceae bacterium]|nr:glycosyltransferase family 2 protein [Nitrospiraceae bacterium]
MSGYRISVIMPSLNEAENIGRAVRNVAQAFERYGIEGEIIIVNDGSTDDTGLIAAGLAAKHPFLRVLRHEKPQGIGASFWDGVGNAGGEIVTMIPGDGENDAAETLRYLPVMEHVDIVVPYVFNKEVRSAGRRLLSALYRGIVNTSFGLTLNYMNGTVMYRRCVLQGITFRSRGFFYQTELLIKCIRKGYLYAEVPYALERRAAGASKATTLASLLKVTRNYMTVLADIYLKGGAGGGIAPDSVTAKRRGRTGEGGIAEAADEGKGVR